MSKFVQILRSVSFPLGRVGVGLLLFALTACHTTSQAPLDDAYIWPDKTTPVTNPAATPATMVADEPVSAGPTLEYTNVQDTTITVRIKR